MKKFFAKQMYSCIIESITQEEITHYYLLLTSVMKKMGATEQEIGLIHESTIRNSIYNNRKPEDVAWAILQ